jgi:signal transduction histidine kinase
MATTLENARVNGPSAGTAHPLVRAAFLSVAPLSATAAIVAAVDGWDGGVGGRFGWVCLTLVWAVAGAALLLRREQERLGLLVLWFALLAGAASLTAAMVEDGPGSDATALAQALTVAFLPAAAMHVLLALPSGALGTRVAAFIVGSGYLIAAAVGVVLWTDRPSASTWPVVVEAFVAAAVGGNGAMARYRAARLAERRPMHWVALAIAAATEVVLVAAALHVLVGWPPRVIQIAAVATIPIPLALLLRTSTRFQARAERLVAPAISLVGLTALVAAVYFLVVVGLGRAPTDDERTVLVLSIVAAGISALLYVPARQRLADFSNRLVHGARQAPDEVIRAFSERLSRAVPLEELLLQIAESLRAALAVEAAEIWTGSGGVLERVVSEPDRGHAELRLSSSEESVVARAGVSGPARIAVWLPQLLADRGDAVVRVAPMAHSGELFGLIVVEQRSADGDPFDEEAEKVLAELARQVGLAMRNVRLDSDLHASLEELRRQAEELRASRARVVAAADAERRRIERDLHDGAQQYLVGLEVNLRVVCGLVDSDSEKAKAILDELRATVQEAMQDFRDLAHGIYPPLLQDRGLSEALANAARRATIPTRIEAPAARRYDPEMEATVYFCCLEALQNAGKHAGPGARATIRLREEEDALLFEVADDGSGLDPALAGSGTGFTNMRDRLEALGGSLRIESTLSRGTRVVGTLPLAH